MILHNSIKIVIHDIYIYIHYIYIYLHIYIYIYVTILSYQFIEIEFHLNWWMFTSIVQATKNSPGKRWVFQGLDDVGAVVIVVVVASFLEVIARPQSFQQPHFLIFSGPFAHFLAHVQHLGRFLSTKENHHAVMQSDLLDWVQLHLDSDSMLRNIENLSPWDKWLELANGICMMFDMMIYRLTAHRKTQLFLQFSGFSWVLWVWSVWLVVPKIALFFNIFNMAIRNLSMRQKYIRNPTISHLQRRNVRVSKGHKARSQRSQRPGIGLRQLLLGTISIGQHVFLMILAGENTQLGGKPFVLGGWLGRFW